MSAVGLLVGGCSSTPSAEANAVYKQGLKQAEAGQTDAALQTLRKGIESHPSHVRMRFELARLQYEKGEAHHLRERQAMRKAAQWVEKGRRDQALAERRKGNDHRAKALPYYKPARHNLKIVVWEEDDEKRAAWAHFLLMRVDLFFEDFEEAYQNIEQAILLGRPTGALLAQWREFQAGLREKISLTE